MIRQSTSALRLMMVALLTIAATAWAAAAPPTTASGVRGVVDLSLPVSADLPSAWPSGMTPYVILPARTIGLGAYNRDTVCIDEHTGTQWDAPAHFVPPPDSGLAGAGPMGLITGDKVPVWQFCGEACVIDVTAHIDDAAPGHSYLIPPDTVLAWEKSNRKLGPGDVVLFRSDYTDKYYLPFPAGDRLVVKVLNNKAPGWPAPLPETMKLLGERQVWASGLDGASMGPVPDLAAATHQAGGQYGLIWTECATNLSKLPVTGSFTFMGANKHAGSSGGEARPLAITEPKLAAELLKRTRQKHVADLSVLLEESYPVTWTGTGPGDQATRYLAKTLNAFDPARGPYFARTHMLDTQVGTHLVTPSVALPPADFDNKNYSAELREQLAKYEQKYGKRGTSDMTVEKVPLEDLMGPAYIIDVKELLGSGSTGSPKITVKHVQAQEAKTRPIAAGDVVIFRSGYTDQYFKPIPDGTRLMADPLAGKAEGWAAPDADVIAYLAGKGVRCVGTDGPSLGGTDAENALAVYWLAATRGMQLVEFLTNLGSLPQQDAFFIFAPIKLKGSHGGYGRAVALYP